MLYNFNMSISITQNIFNVESFEISVPVAFIECINGPTMLIVMCCILLGVVDLLFLVESVYLLLKGLSWLDLTFLIFLKSVSTCK